MNLKKVKLLAIEKNKTILQVAKEAGISRSRLYQLCHHGKTYIVSRHGNIEKQTHRATLKTVKKVADALGVTILEIE